MCPFEGDYLNLFCTVNERSNIHCKHMYIVSFRSVYICLSK